MAVLNTFIRCLLVASLSFWGSPALGSTEGGFEFSRPSFGSPVDSAATLPQGQTELATGLWLSGLGPESWTSTELLLTGFSLLGASLIATVYRSWLKEKKALEQHNKEVQAQLEAMEAELGEEGPKVLEKFGLDHLRQRGNLLGSHSHSAGMEVFRPYDQLERDLAEAVEVLKLYEQLYLQNLNSASASPTGEALQSLPAWEESAAFLYSQGWWPSQRRIELQPTDISHPSSQNILALLHSMQSKEEQLQKHSASHRADQAHSCGPSCTQDHGHHHHHHHHHHHESSPLAEFFSQPLVRSFKENFLARSALWTVRSVKVLLWDYGLKPLHQSLTHPQQIATRLSAQSRVARNENALNAYVGGALGFSLFWAYEAIIHGLLHIHFMCNHAFQYSLAMTTAGAMLSPIHYFKESLMLFRNKLGWRERQKLVWALKREKGRAGAARKNFWLGSRVVHQREFMRDHHSHGLWENFTDQVKLSSGWYLLSQDFSKDEKKIGGSIPSSHQQVLDLQAELQLEILSLQKALSTAALLQRFASGQQMSPALDTLGQIKKALSGLEDLLHLKVLVGEAALGSDFSKLMGGLSDDDMVWVEEQIRWQLHELRQGFLQIHGSVEPNLESSSLGFLEVKSLSRKLNRFIQTIKSGADQQTLQASRLTYQEERSKARDCLGLLQGLVRK